MKTRPNEEETMSVDFHSVWSKHLTGAVKGSYVELQPDLVFGHEATMSLVLPQLRELKGPRIPSSRLFFVVDHFAPPSSAAFADIVSDFRRFCGEYGIDLAQFEGIGHRLMLESGRVNPGDLVVGADSHTPTIGGKGALGIGLGSTDILAVLMTGTVWLKRPAVSRVVLEGRLGPFVEAKDIVFHLLGKYGQAGFPGEVIEFADQSPERLGIEELAVLTNMSVEMGAVSGLAVEHGSAGTTGIRREIRVDLGELDSLAAKPGSPADVVEARHLSGVKIDTAILGSCASGGIFDLTTAAKLLSGRRVNRGTTLLVTPSTRRVYAEAVERGLISILLDAGATILNPSCGACGGIDKGIPGAGDVVVTTAPRNFASRLRAGSKVYLASTATVVASAIEGRMTAPGRSAP